jgi:hypothetical protein
MTKHTTEVELGGEQFEVVFDDESGLVHRRRTEAQLRDALSEDPDEMAYINDTRTMGVTDDHASDAYWELADRLDHPVAEMYVTPRILADFADRVFDEFNGQAVRLTLSPKLSLNATTQDSDRTVMLAPRVHDDFTYEHPDMNDGDE